MSTREERDAEPSVVFNKVGPNTEMSIDMVDMYKSLEEVKLGFISISTQVVYVKLPSYSPIARLLAGILFTSACSATLQLTQLSSSSELNALTCSGDDIGIPGCCSGVWAVGHKVLQAGPPLPSHLLELQLHFQGLGTLFQPC